MQQELKILNTISSLFIFAAGLLGPMYAVFVEGIGGDLVTAGTAYFIFSIASGIFIFAISRWEDRFKHQEKIIAFGYGMGCIGFLGYLFVRSPVDMFIVQIILGVAIAIRSPVFDSIYSRHLDAGRYTSEWGVWESMNMIMAGMSALIGGIVAQTYGFPALFTLMFAVSLVGFAVSLALLKIKYKD